MSIEHNPVLAEYPNAAFNVFLMMRFANTVANRRVVGSLRTALRRYGMNLLRADQKAYSESLWENVKYHMYACDLGVAVFEQIVKKDFNPNVSLELGHMLALGKKVLLLKEHSLPRLPSDIVGHLYKEFDARDIATTIRSAVDAWLRDVGIAKSSSEKLIVFVSYGGTCRCAMSKIVARKAFEGRNLPFSVRFESMAATYGTSVRASNGARKAIREAFGEDLLESHRVMKRNRGIVEDADLILVMDQKLLAGLPPKKTQLLSEFFGFEGDIKNPWPDYTKDAEQKYRTCLTQLRSFIEPNADRLITQLA
jgi:protein-tyrosine-phosphatase